jgi:curved DNA-binding protein CbpA
MTDHYQELGVSKTASANEIRQAYARLAKEKHPDRFLDPAEKERAHAEFQQLTAAFNTLYNSNSRREYDASLERPTPTNPEEIAKDAFERSGEMLEAGQVQEAVTLLHTAVHHAPNEARFYHALGRALVRNRSAREAIQAIEKAIQLQPKEALYHAELAVVLQGQSLTVRAKKAAEAALRLAPRDPRIRRLAGELGITES